MAEGGNRVERKGIDAYIYIYTHTPIIQFQLCNHALHNRKNYIEKKKNRFTEN